MVNWLVVLALLKVLLKMLLDALEFLLIVNVLHLLLDFQLFVHFISKRRILIVITLSFT